MRVYWFGYVSKTVSVAVVTTTMFSSGIQTINWPPWPLAENVSYPLSF